MFLKFYQRLTKCHKFKNPQQPNLDNCFAEIGKPLQLLTLALVIFPLSRNKFHFWPFEHLAGPLNILAFVGNQEGETISRGSGTNFLPPCVKHTLAHLLASLVFALLVLSEWGEGITFAAAGEGCCCCFCFCWEKESRGICYQHCHLHLLICMLRLILASLILFPFSPFQPRIFASLELYSPFSPVCSFSSSSSFSSSIYESPFYHHAGRQPAPLCNKIRSKNVLSIT